MSKDTLGQRSGIRAIFNIDLKVISQSLWFCIATLCDWLKNIAHLSQLIKPKPIGSCSQAFPRYMNLLRVRIGSSDCAPVRVITLFSLVLRHSTEN